MSSLIKGSASAFTWNKLGEELLKYDPRNPTRCSRQDEWIEYYIANHSSDKKAIKILFGIICNCSEKQLLFTIVTLCKYNKSFEVFSGIHITPTHVSWSGSELPVIERRITFLENLNDSLSGYDFIEHRVLISKYIQTYIERKEKILLKEFLEEK